MTKKTRQKLNQQKIYEGKLSQSLPKALDVSLFEELLTMPQVPDINDVPNLEEKAKIFEKTLFSFFVKNKLVPDQEIIDYLSSPVAPHIENEIAKVNPQFSNLGVLFFSSEHSYYLREALDKITEQKNEKIRNLFQNSILNISANKKYENYLEGSYNPNNFSYSQNHILILLLPTKLANAAFNNFTNQESQPSKRIEFWWKQIPSQVDYLKPKFKKFLENQVNQIKLYQTLHEAEKPYKTNRDKNVSYEISEEKKTVLLNFAKNYIENKADQELAPLKFVLGPLACRESLFIDLFENKKSPSDRYPSHEKLFLLKYIAENDPDFNNDLRARLISYTGGGVSTNPLLTAWELDKEIMLYPFFHSVPQFVLENKILKEKVEIDNFLTLVDLSPLKELEKPVSRKSPNKI